MSILSTITGLWGSFWVKLGLLLIVAGGIFYGGYHYATLKDQATIASYENKLNHDSEGLSEFNLLTNNTIDTVVVTKTKTVTKIIHDTLGTIPNVPDVDTVLSKGWISVFNGSVMSEVPTQKEVADNTPGATAIEALTVIVKNNGVCTDLRNEVIAWQQWYNDEQQQVAKINKQNGVKPPKL